MKKKAIGFVFLLICATFILITPVYGVETAPRISDREIIESLAELKAGQTIINQRFEAVDQRFEAVDQRFDSVDKRLDFIQNLIIVLIGCIAGLIGYIVWDRKTALRPVEDRLIHLEANLEKDLQLFHKDGSRLTRMINAFRELAKTDKKVAEVLRSFSLL